MADPIVGIDLGTTNSVVAVCDAQGPRVLADDRGTKIHPSVVSFHPNASVVVGVDAKQRRVIDPRNTVTSAKRLIGRAFRSPEIQAASQRASYQIKEGANQQPVIVTRAGEFAVPEISAIVLDHVRGVASKATGQDVTRAVVTVPASFNDSQRSATATAGAIAGITVVRVLNEPTAAALAYGHARQLSQVIAVYDFGGGTFDVTILRLQDQVYEVLATAGDSFLGGDDIDEALMEQLAADLLRQHRVDIHQHEVGVMRLRAVAEQTKIELSRRTRAIVKVDEIAYGPGGAAIDLETEVTRDQLVQRAKPMIERTFTVCSEALRLAGLGPEAIEDVVMVGGTSKMPYVRDRVSQFFGRAPRADINPEEAVALGAALQAAALERILSRRPSSRLPTSATTPPPSFDESTTHAQRSRTADEATIPAAPSPPSGRVTHRTGAAPPPVPVRTAGAAAARTMIGIASPPLPRGETGTGEITRERFGEEGTRPDSVSPTARPDQHTLFDDPPAPRARPDQRTMLAAAPPSMSPAQLPTMLAPQFSAPAPAMPSPVVIDVTPRGLGIGTVGGYCEELIHRNARVPAEQKRMFTTSRDQQRMVRIRICQGESRRIDDNVILGDLVLDGLPPRPRGRTSIEVTFQLDASGILQVRARDAETGQEQRASLDVVGAQSPAEVDAARERFDQMRR